MYQRGVRIVATGLGGDQLFEHIPDRETFDFNDAAPMLRAGFVGERITSPDLNLPASMLSSNTVSEYVTRTNTYLQYDIWPVSPFNDVSLAAYVRALPVQFRDNKNILRAYYQAAQFPESVYREENEDFHTYFTAIMCRQDMAERIRTAGKQALTEQLGIADLTVLHHMYAQLQQAGPDPNAQLFLIYHWLNTECNIKLAKHKRQLVL
jgi:hypothetical protein